MLSTVIIRCAGRGSRLYPLTKHTSKPMLELGDYKIIDYSIVTHRNAQNSKGSGFDVVASYEEARALSCRLTNS